MNKNIRMINSTPKESIVAMRVCTKCMPSSAISAQSIVAQVRFLNSSRPKKYIAGSISTPASVPAKRQAKGVMPISDTHQAIISLPSGGWVHS